MFRTTLQLNRDSCARDDEVEETAHLRNYLELKLASGGAAVFPSSLEPHLCYPPT
jgi:hypothetical protein